MIEDTYSLTRVSPYRYLVWLWGHDRFIEEAMVFQNGGTESKTLEFFVFCNQSQHANEVVHLSLTESQSPNIQLFNISDIQELEAEVHQDKQADTVSDLLFNDTEFHSMATESSGSYSASESTGTADSLSTTQSTFLETTEPPEMNIRPLTFPWNRITDHSQCKDLFEDMKDYMYGQNDAVTFYLRYNSFVNRINEQNYQVFLSAIDTIYANSTYSEFSIKSHNICVEMREKTENISNILFKTMTLGVNISKTDSFDEAYHFGLQLLSLHRDRLQYDPNNFKTMEDTYDSACGWLYRYGSDSLVNGRIAMRDFDDALDHKEAALRQFRKIQSSFASIFESVYSVGEPAILKMVDFLNQNCTKLELATYIDTPVFTNTINYLTNALNDFSDAVKDYQEEMIRGREKMTAAYQVLAELKLPILNSYTIYQLTFMQAALLVNGIDIHDMAGGLDIEDHFHENMTTLITDTYQKLMDPVEQLEEGLAQPLTDILVQFQNIASGLLEYQASAKMNTVFFM